MTEPNSFPVKIVRENIGRMQKTNNELQEVTGLTSAA